MPNHFKVGKVELWGLFSGKGGDLTLETIQKVVLMKKMSLNGAMKLVHNLFQEEKVNFKKKLLLPVFCIGNVNPIINGIDSIVSTNIPDSFKEDLKEIKLEKPLEMKFVGGGKEKGVIVNTLLDLSKERILIIGDFNNAIEQIKNVLQKFSIPYETAEKAVERIWLILKTYVPKPISTKVAIGGFGAIYAFLFSFVVSEVVRTSFSRWEYFPFFFGLLATVSFLTLEAYEDKIIAFTPTWVIKVIIFCWLLFLVEVFSSFFVISGMLCIQLFLPIFNILSICLLITASIRVAGSVILNKGFSKAPVIILWMMLIFGIILFSI